MMLISKRQRRNQMGRLKKYFSWYRCLMLYRRLTGLWEKTGMPNWPYMYAIMTEMRRNQKRKGMRSLLVLCLRKSVKPS